MDAKEAGQCEVKTVGLIPRNRLTHLPKHVRVYHELCFFLHDECVRALHEYETARAHVETIDFLHPGDGDKFQDLADRTDAVGALREPGYQDAPKKVVLNTIRMALISDCMHHVYEALRCFEKRKVVVGFNLLRKPLIESLLYLSWMCGMEDDFYSQFIAGDPKALTLQVLSQKRKEIYSTAIDGLGYYYMFDPEILENTINNKQDLNGFQMLFQHAAHLVTTWSPQIQTASENFNFVFKNPFDDDVYDFFYERIPIVLLFMSHVVIELFDRMRKMDELSKHLFEIRTVMAYQLIAGTDRLQALSTFEDLLSVRPKCPMCSREGKTTVYNATRMLLRSEFRCTFCGTLSPHLLFSYPDLGD